jgi:hypothetical protein
MKRALTILGVAIVLGVGVTAAVALGAGGSSNNASTSTKTTAVKVSLCHHTGSWKHPYHLIHVSSHAVDAHRRHGDVDPGASNSCPTSQPPGAKSHPKAGKPDEGEKDNEKSG